MFRSRKRTFGDFNTVGSGNKQVSGILESGNKSCINEHVQKTKLPHFWFHLDIPYKVLLHDLWQVIWSGKIIMHGWVGGWTSSKTKIRSIFNEKKNSKWSKFVSEDPYDLHKRADIFRPHPPSPFRTQPQTQFWMLPIWEDYKINMLPQNDKILSSFFFRANLARQALIKMMSKYWLEI